VTELFLYLLVFLPSPFDVADMHMVKITAYTARVQETDSTPTITASNKRVKEGYVALSRDLERRYNLKFGDRIYLERYGIFEFQDRMHRRKRGQVDIYMSSLKRAKQFGVKSGQLLIWKRRR